MYLNSIFVKLMVGPPFASSAFSSRTGRSAISSACTLCSPFVIFSFFSVFIFNPFFSRFLVFDIESPVFDCSDLHTLQSRNTTAKPVIRHSALADRLWRVAEVLLQLA